MVRAELETLGCLTPIKYLRVPRQSVPRQSVPQKALSAPVKALEGALAGPGGKIELGVFNLEGKKNASS
jgi:hypothetical protein